MLTRLPFVDRCRSVLSAVVRASSRVRSVGGARSRSFGQGLIFETRARQVVEREIGGWDGARYLSGNFKTRARGVVVDLH